jgi:hypothetical protein
MSIATREEWLTDLTSSLRPRFADAGYPLPVLRLSCGWPKPGGGGMRHARLLGTTWFSSLDGHPQIFISPTLIEPVEVGTTLVHELAHTVVGPEAKHGAEFQRVAAAVGLERPWNETPAGAQLTALLLELAAELGPYPHAELPEPTPRRSVPSVKCTCSTCGYRVSVRPEWLQLGNPLCPEGDRLER